MTTDFAAPTTSAIPSMVRRLDPIVQAALRLGVPMGPNVLLTVRGRRTGIPRSVPVAIPGRVAPSSCSRRSARSPGSTTCAPPASAEIRHGRRRRAVDARELSPEEAAPHLEAGLQGVLRVPGLGPMIAGWYGITAASTPADYLAAASRHPAFALRPRT